MRFGALASSLLSVFLFTRSSSAIYADEAYQVDYHHALFGIPQEHTTFFHRPSATSNGSLLYTLSQNGIVGARNPKDGSVLWRQRLCNEGQNYTGHGQLTAGEGSNTIVSALYRTVQAWDAADGRFGWEHQTDAEVKALAVVGKGRECGALVLSGEGDSKAVIQYFSLETGELQWKLRDSSGDVPYSIFTAKGQVFYISLHSALLKGFKIKATELNPSNGQQKGQTHIFSSETEVFSKDSVLFAGGIGGLPTVIWSDKASKFVKVASILKGQVTTLGALSSDGHVAEKISVRSSSDSQSQPHFLLHLSGGDAHWAKMYHLETKTGTAVKAHDLPTVSGKGSFSTSVQRSELYYVHHRASEIALYSSISATSLRTWKVPPKPFADTTSLRDVLHGVTEVAVRGDSKFSVRSAVTLSTGDWELVQNGESFWITPEGLTGVVTATFVESTQAEELAQELAVEGQFNFASAYLHRLKRHVKEMQLVPAWIEDQYRILGATLRGDAAPNQVFKTRRDKFGFSKLVIIATKRGRLAAIDAGHRGRVIWNIQAVAPERGVPWDVQGIDAEIGTALVRGAKGEFLRVETATGKIIHHQKGSLLEGLDTTIAVTDINGQEALVPVNVDASLGELPNADFDPQTVVITKGGETQLKGWSLPKKGRALQIWQFVPFFGDRIIDVKHRSVHDPVASIGKAMGDRNVLYKYLNPNLILITAIHEQASSARLYLIDSISGNILHTISHSGVDFTQPISSAIFENFFVYSLFSKTISQDALQLEQHQLQSYQLVVSELYESPYPNHRGPLGSASNYSSIQPPSTLGESADHPHVISQVFLAPGPISHMAVTSTLQGITPRSLLCVLPRTNALVSIPRQILDPRRPVGRDPTPSEMEEGLFRYSSSLDFEPKWSLNHKREFLGLSEVITVPSLLESTSMVFAFGDADIFGTRTSPIGGFDILGKGFSKLQLVGTVAVLALGTSVLAPMVCLHFSLLNRLCQTDLTLQVRKKQIDGIWKA